MINILDNSDRTFDAIVIGSGMSGGWAAKELAEKGLKTLVLERGREVNHIKDYPTTNMYPYEFKHRGKLPESIINENPIVSKCHAFDEEKQHFLVKDKEHPYIQEKPFDWIRGYQTGGRSLLWGRQVQRWSEFDFIGPERDGYAVPWPIGYNDLAPWYSHVEKFIGVSGNKDGLRELPDGEFLPPMELTAAEEYFQKVVSSNYTDRNVIIGRCAHITGNYEFYAKQGRGGCKFRNLCRRGCPFGGSFCSNSSTLPWALNTGNLTIRNHSVVHSVIYDETKNRASGVKVIDALTKEEIDYYSTIVFVNAGSLNTNLILLNSISHRFPQGLGNDNGIMGKYITFHNYRARISAEYDGLLDYTTFGRRPNHAYIPRFRNVYKHETKDFIRGYAASFSGRRQILTGDDNLGLALKKSLVSPSYGPWRVGAAMKGEVIPTEKDRVTLDKEKTDDWGIPQLRISVDYCENDENMMKDFYEQFQEMFHIAGFTNIKTRDDGRSPGLDIHEMGGCRMGKDPNTSILNNGNQMHSCKNVFVSDGACMTSASTQNPSLTYMALTARAVDYAVNELKKRNI